MIIKVVKVDALLKWFGLWKVRSLNQIRTTELIWNTTAHRNLRYSPSDRLIQIRCELFQYLSCTKLANSADVDGGAELLMVHSPHEKWLAFLTGL